MITKFAQGRKEFLQTLQNPRFQNTVPKIIQFSQTHLKSEEFDGVNPIQTAIISSLGIPQLFSKTKATDQID